MLLNNLSLLNNRIADLIYAEQPQLSDRECGWVATHPRSLRSGVDRKRPMIKCR